MVNRAGMAALTDHEKYIRTEELLGALLASDDVVRAVTTLGRDVRDEPGYHG